MPGYVDREKGIFVETFRGPALEQELSLAGITPGCRFRNVKNGLVLAFLAGHRVNGVTWLSGEVLDAAETTFPIGHRLMFRIGNCEVLDAMQ